MVVIANGKISISGHIGVHSFQRLQLFRGRCVSRVRIFCIRYFTDGGFTSKHDLEMSRINFLVEVNLMNR